MVALNDVDIYMLFLLAAGWIIIALGIYTIKKYVENKGLQHVKIFSILLFSAAIWIFGVILSFVTPTNEETYFWEKFKYIGTLLIPPTWVWMCIQWSGRGRWLSSKVIGLLYLISTLFIVLVFTDHFHHLIWSNIEYIKMGRYVTTSVVHGIGWWSLLVYSYLLILIGNLYLMIGLIKLKNVYRKQAIILLISSFAPWIANFLFAMGLTPVTEIDYSPAVFIITGLGILYGFSQFSLIELVPIARETVFEELEDPIIVLDTKNRIVDFTPSAKILFEDRSKAIGKHVSYAINQDVLKDFLIKGDTYGELEVVGEDELKHFFCIKVNPLTDDRGEKIGRIVSFRDVTEYKKVERELRESEKMYRSIFENTGTATVIIEENGIISLANTGFENLSGYSRDEIEGKKYWTDFVAKKDLERMKKYHMDRLSNRDVPSNYEFHFVDRNGIVKDIYLTIALIPDTKKSVASLLDVTERNMMINELKDAHEILFAMNKDLERKVKERTEEIERLMKQKDAFINQLGHDLKTPLTPMMILLPILKKEARSEKSKELFDVVIRNVHYMKDLVSKTIELAKLNSNKIEFNMENLNLLDEITSVIENNQILFNENNINIINNVREDLIVYADKLRLTELLTNLLTNAVKYMPSEGGSITIDAEKKDDEVKVSIRDTGIGMTEEQIRRIFDEFYKADESRHDLDSSGLGLSIAKRIVEKHGGKIWAESPGKGKGSTFYFTLPIGKEQYEENLAAVQ